MASSGKKGKKSKGTVLSLQTFLRNSGAPAGTTQIAKNIRNFDGDDSDDGENVLTVVCQLPTAPRANRILDDSSIPHTAPFIAYVTNLPFDVHEEHIYEFFSKYNVKSVRLPREDGDTGRVRGFGYVEFESRNDLIQSLSLSDPSIKGRRIRIDLFNENEQNPRQRGPKRGYDLSESNAENREVSNWRRDNNTKRDSYSFGGERSFRDQKYTSDENNSPGSWRKRNENTTAISSSVERLHQKDQDERCIDKNNTLERPKLMLKPRTLPLPEVDIPSKTTLESKINNNNSLKFTGTSAEKVFGSAKPVDTLARDLEIEERLADVRRQDNLKKEIEQISNGLDELNVAKDETIKRANWRHKNDADILKNPDRNLRTDSRNEYGKETRKRYNDKMEGCDNQKLKEVKKKDISKIRHEIKVERPGGKQNRNHKEPVLSANKYSGLQDDSD